MRIRRRAATAIVAAAMIVVAGCGGDDDDSGDTADAATSSETAGPSDTSMSTEPASEPATAPDESQPAPTEPADTSAPDSAPSTEPAAPVEGKVSFGIIAEFLPLVEPILQAFEDANPDVELEIQAYPLQEYPTVIQTNLGAGSPPDVFVAETGSQIAFLSSNGLIVDITDEIDIEVPGTVSDLFGPGDGRLYGLPIGTVAQGTIFNQAVFDEAGLSVPTTFAEVLDACAALQEQGVTPIALAGADANHSGITITTLAASTVFAADPDFGVELAAGNRTFSGDGGYRVALERYVELRDAGCFGEAAAGQSLAEAHQQVASGTAAMIIERVSTMPAIQELNPDGTIGVFPFPGGDTADDTSVVVTVPFTFSVASATQNLEAAVALVKFIALPENVEVISMAAEMLPLTIDPSELPESLSLMAPAFEAGRVVANPSSIWTSEINEAVDLGAQQLLLGDGDIDAVLEALDSASEAD